MKSSILTALCLLTTLIAGTIPTISIAQPADENSSGTVQFSCGRATDPSSRKVIPATIATVAGNPESTVLIMWKSEFFGNKYNPQERCSIVSRKIDQAFQEGRTHIGSGMDKTNGLGIICGIANRDQPCDQTNMILTLKSYQSANETIDRLGEILQGKIGEPIYQNIYGKRVNLGLLLRK
jgi:Circadian oscillating protein COP23